MSISLHCSQCSNRIKLPDSAAGRKFRCRQCGAVETVPGVAAAGAGSEELDLGSLMVDDELELEKDAEPAIDWNEISPPMKAEEAKTPSTAMTPAPAPPSVSESVRGPVFSSPAVVIGRSSTRYEPSQSAAGPGSTVRFVVDAIMAVPASLAHLPAIIMLIILGFAAAVVAGVIGLIGSVALNQSRQVPPAALLTLIIFGLLPYITYAAYTARFWLLLTDEASRGRNSALPDNSFSDMARSLLLWFLFIVVYILPVVTLPLAPVAFLAMARSNNFQAFHLPWVIGQTMRNAGYVFVASCVAMFTLGAGVLGTGAVLQEATVDMIRWRHGVTPEHVAEASADARKMLLMIAGVAIPLMCLVMAAVCQVIAMVGLHRPEIYRSMPRHANVFEGIGMAAAGVGFTYVTKGLAPVILIGLLLAPIAHDRIPTTAGDMDPSEYSPHPLDPYADSYWEPTTRWLPRDDSLPPLTPQAPQFPTVPEPDPAKATPSDMVLFHAGNLRSRDAALRLRALLWLADAEPLAAARHIVVSELTQRLPQLYDAAEAKACVDAFMRWSTDPDAVLITELSRRRPHAQYVATHLGMSRSPRAAEALVQWLANETQLTQGPQVEAWLRPVLKAMPDEARVEDAFVAALTNRQSFHLLSLLTVMEDFVTAKSLPALRPLVKHEQDAVADKAVRLIKQVAPDQWSALDDALMPLEKRGPTYNRVVEGLGQLLEIKPNDADRPRVLAALLPSVERAEIRLSPQHAKALARWADEELIKSMVDRLTRTQDFQVIANLAAVLGAAGTKQAIAPLVEQYDRNTAPCKAALTAMGRPAEDYVLERLRSGSFEEKIQAARILGSIGTQTSLPTLSLLAKAKNLDQSLRNAVRNAGLEVEARMRRK